MSQEDGSKNREIRAVANDKEEIAANAVSVVPSTAATATATTTTATVTTTTAQTATTTTATATTTTAQTATTTTPKKRALFVACMYTGSAQALSGCNNDQKNLVDFVHRIAPDCELRVLSDDASSLSLPAGITLFGSSTHQNIIAGLRWLRQAKQMWFSYSGHGSYRYCRRGQEEVDGRDETIVPTDWERTGDIADDTLRAELVDHLPADARLTALFDSCHSGTALDLRFNFLDESKPLNAAAKKTGEYRPSEWRRSLAKQEHRGCPATTASVCMLSGCRDTETSADAIVKGVYTGAMTYAYLYFADPKQPGHALRDEKSRTIGNLLQDMNCWLEANAYDQRPQLSFGNEATASSIDREWKVFE